MTTNLPKTPDLSLVPDIPRGIPIVTESGDMHDLWKLYFDQLSAALTTLFKPEGYVIPPQSATNIANLTGNPSFNNIIYDSTNNVFKGNIQGIWYTFVTVPGSIPINNIFLTMTP